MAASIRVCVEVLISGYKGSQNMILQTAIMLRHFADYLFSQSIPPLKSHMKRCYCVPLFMTEVMLADWNFCAYKINGLSNGKSF